VSDDRHDEEQVTASERRLLALLQLLADGDRAGDDLRRSVMRRVRWQHALRGTLTALGVVAVSVVDGLGLVFGLDRRRKR
jgi:hypothetical protein